MQKTLVRKNLPVKRQHAVLISDHTRDVETVALSTVVLLPIVSFINSFVILKYNNNGEE